MNTVFVKKVAAVFIIGLLAGLILGYGSGYAKGAGDTISWGIKVASALMERDKINIEFDEDMIETAILQYKNNINGCLFIE